MTPRYYCAIFPFCGGGKKAFYDWATTGIPVINTGVPDPVTILGRHIDCEVLKQLTLKSLSTFTQVFY